MQCFEVHTEWDWERREKEKHPFQNPQLQIKQANQVLTLTIIHTSDLQSRHHIKEFEEILITSGTKKPWKLLSVSNKLGMGKNELLSNCNDLVGILRDKRDVNVLTHCLDDSKSLRSASDADFNTTQIAISG